ncbi:MAG: hypothetical protein GEU98_24380 [Pseudonocardiaceae bacterium]|nr:hypothetical protein [Pseudonocardiaceae bacterium]
MMQIWFWVAISLLFVLIVVFAYAGRKRSTSIGSHQVPEGLGFVSLALSTAATQASPATFLGVAGFAFTSGLSGLWWIIVVPLAYTGGLVLVSKGFRRVGLRFGSLSLPDWMGARYQSNLIRVLVATLYLASVFFVVAQFSGMGQILAVVGGIDYKVGLIAVAVVVSLYTLIGGNYAVVKTDAWQAAFMALVSLGVAVGVLFVFSSVGEISERLADQGPKLTAVFNDDFPIYSGILALAGIAVFQAMNATPPHVVNRLLMLGEQGKLRPYILLTGVTVLLLSMSAVAGVAAKALVADQVQAPDQASLVLVEVIFPAGLAALFAVGVVAAAISTVNSVLSSMGASVGNDIYRRLALRNSGASVAHPRVDKIALSLTRVTILVSTLVALTLAWNPPEFLAVIAALGLYGFFAGVSGPLVLGIFWRRATPVAAAVTVLAGPAFFFLLNFVLEVTPNVFINGAFSIIFSFALMYAVSLVTPKMSASFTESVVAGGATEVHDGRAQS